MSPCTAASDNVKPVTHLLAIDPTTIKGMKLLREGIRYLVSLLILDVPFLVVVTWKLLTWLTRNISFDFQLDGSTQARVGVLFGSNMAADSPGYIFVKIFQVTTSLNRYVIF